MASESESPRSPQSLLHLLRGALGAREPLDPPIPAVLSQVAQNCHPQIEEKWRGSRLGFCRHNHLFTGRSTSESAALLEYSVHAVEIPHTAGVTTTSSSESTPPFQYAGLEYPLPRVKMEVRVGSL